MFNKDIYNKKNIFLARQPSKSIYIFTEVRKIEAEPFLTRNSHEDFPLRIRNLKSEAKNDKKD